MKIYGLKNCDTCRKAVKALGGEMVDVRQNPLSDAELAEFFDAFGDTLLNTRSTTWRGLEEAERSKPPADLLKTHPALMKRPVIRSGDTLHLGWGKDVQAALL